MLIITVQVNRPSFASQAVKEQIAMDLEKYGDTRIISIEEVKPKEPVQMTIFPQR